MKLVDCFPFWWFFCFYSFLIFPFLCAWAFCLYVHLCTRYMQCLSRLQEGIGAPGCGFIGPCEPQCGAWELNPGHLEGAVGAPNCWMTNPGPSWQFQHAVFLLSPFFFSSKQVSFSVSPSSSFPHPRPNYEDPSLCPGPVSFSLMSHVSSPHPSTPPIFQPSLGLLSGSF